MENTSRVSSQALLLCHAAYDNFTITKCNSFNKNKSSKVPLQNRTRWHGLCDSCAFSHCRITIPCFLGQFQIRCKRVFGCMDIRAGVDFAISNEAIFLPKTICDKYTEIGITSVFPWQAECLKLPGVLGSIDYQCHAV